MRGLFYSQSCAGLKSWGQNWELLSVPCSACPPWQKSGMSQASNGRPLCHPPPTYTPPTSAHMHNAPDYELKNKGGKGEKKKKVEIATQTPWSFLQY